jgi:hypothetical protein
MQIEGSGSETYLFLNGISAPRRIRLSAHVHLLPGDCTADSDLIVSLFEKRVDLGVAAIFLGLVTSQLHVVAPTAKDLAISAWNSVWDGILLSALFHCEAVCNFQSDTPAEKLTTSSTVKITNYHLRGLSHDAPCRLSDIEADWVEQHFTTAQALLSQSAFQNAVHCLATYRWHSLPRARLALLWAGIEGLFNVESELVFRISLYTARFLEPSDEKARQALFAAVKTLYNQRSKAVNGARIKGDINACVEQSAALLQRLVRGCVTINSLPNPESLAP